MRGRRALREPQCHSLCAFCSHRFVNVRPSHVQRRFLQSSRSASSGAQAVALKPNNDDDKPTPAPAPMSGGWGAKPTFGAAPNFGRPTFGTAAASNPGSTTIELSPEEQAIRNRLRQKAQEEQKRAVNIPMGPGPEATRAGRPMPDGYDNRISGRQSEYQPRSRPIVRMTGKSSQPDSSQPLPEQSTSWGHLRRLSEHPMRRSNPQPNSFDRDRAQREAQTRSGKYVSLNGRSIFDRNSQTNDPPAAESPRPTNSLREWGSEGALRSRNSSNTRVDWRGEALDSTQRSGNSAGARESDTATIRSRESRVEQDGWQPPVQDGWQPQVRASRQSRDVEEEEVRPRGRFAAETSYEKPKLKGKDKDKARRKDRFASHEEEDDDDYFAQEKRRAQLKKQRQREKEERRAAAPPPILLPEFISVANLASALKIRISVFMEKMEELGFEEMTGDHVLNAENAGLIAQEFNFEPIIDRGMSEDLKARPAPEDPSILPPRPPVVTIMGHVDHGKTTLLDYLRKSSVAAGEHGGITQHIGAFSVPMPSGKVITFLDTPGHAAFLSMRQRGANVTDIVILVVAADDGVKPQTIEAINHAKAANVPMIVAVNKIDKEGANVDRAKQDLARHGVDIEDYGGDTQVIEVSGKTGQGMEDLEEAAITLSEMLDMRAETDGPAEGWIIEASIKSMGKVATVLVRRGTMRPGDFVVAGNTWARIRTLRNEAGIEIDEAGPGTPVEIDGWREQPLAGDEVLQATDETKAKRVIEYRLEAAERNKMASDVNAINESRKAEQEKREREKREADIASGKIEAGSEETETPQEIDGTKIVYFIVKGDVSGSVEAVVDSISVLGNNEVQLKVLRSGVGQLSEFDVQHAAVAEGHLINFNTTVDPNIAALAAKAKVNIIDNNVIYRLVDEVKLKLSEKLSPIITQKVTGEADVAQIFEITIKGKKVKAVAGCKVTNGLITRAGKVRVLRGGEKVFDGPLSSLKNVKKDVQEMRKGTECGLGFEEWADFQVGDQIQCYEEISEPRYL